MASTPTLKKNFFFRRFVSILQLLIVLVYVSVKQTRESQTISRFLSPKDNRKKFAVRRTSIKERVEVLIILLTCSEETGAINSWGITVNSYPRGIILEPQ